MFAALWPCGAVSVQRLRDIVWNPKTLTMILLELIDKQNYFVCNNTIILTFFHLFIFCLCSFSSFQQGAIFYCRCQLYKAHPRAFLCTCTTLWQWIKALCTFVLIKLSLCWDGKHNQQRVSIHFKCSLRTCVGFFPSYFIFPLQFRWQIGARLIDQDYII